MDFRKNGAWIVRDVRTCLVLAAVSLLLSSCTRDQADPYLWLESIDGPESMAWVETHNQATIADLQAYPKYEPIHTKIMEIFNSDERIAYPSIRGDRIYNFWQDETNPRGLWRRCSFNEYMKKSPAWETVLDLDALCEREGQAWAFKGAVYCYPDLDRCMLRLSVKGGDAVALREFDLRTKMFVEGGFTVPSAKSDVAWIDRDTLLIGTDFGPGSMTDSGYPRIVKIWERGMPLDEAKTLFEGQTSDVICEGWVQYTPERSYVVVDHATTFYTSKQYVLEDGALIRLELPEDSQLSGFFQNRMLVELKSDWTVEGHTYQQGGLIAIDYDRFLKGDRDFEVICQPDERSSLQSVDYTQHAVLINKLTSVRGQLYQYTFDNGRWHSQKVDVPPYGRISLTSTDVFSDRYFFTYEDFLIPRTLYYSADLSEDIRKVKSLPEFFDGSRFEIQQLEAISKDGTAIPYFIVFAKGMKYDGSNPTLQYGYGGFEISMQPWYSPATGCCWLENGGVYVLANIRGGGEFGPQWHQAAIKEHRQRAYDDFIAVSEDLIRRKITSPEHLGIMGGSNGGLLVGVMFTERPDLYRAVVCSVPLCDMKRYNKLLAGASWMGEYGDPDNPKEWRYIRKYSPYQNLSKSKQYPRVFFATTTRDDRVHPGHARKMAAKMEAMGHDVYYFENVEGGHGAGVTNEQRGLMYSLEYTYLLKMLK